MKLQMVQNALKQKNIKYEYTEEDDCGRLHFMFSGLRFHVGEYHQAFPEHEKKPLQVMEQLAADGMMEMLALVDEDEFAGLAINLIDEEQNRALLDYYAIAPEKRNGGYGSKGLEVLLERFKNYKYIFEIETQNEKAENAEERKRRKAFYLRNGLKETGLFVNVYDTDFELLTPDGELTFWEYVDFLREVMYEEYVEILRPTLIAMKKK